MKPTTTYPLLAQESVHLKRVRRTFRTPGYINFFSRRMSESTVYRTIYYTVYCKLYSIPHSAQYGILGSAKNQCPESSSSTIILIKAVESTKLCRSLLRPRKLAWEGGCHPRVYSFETQPHNASDSWVYKPVLAASERGNQYTVLYTIQYTANFTVYCIVHSTIYWEVPGFKVPEPSDQQSN